MKNLRGQFIIFWKFIGVKFKTLKKLGTKMQNLKDYNNGEIWNFLNLTGTKYFINSHHFENSSNYYSNNIIHLKVFEFSHNITFPQNIPLSKHTLRDLWCFNMQVKFDHRWHSARTCTFRLIFAFFWFILQKLNLDKWWFRCSRVFIGWFRFIWC